MAMAAGTCMPSCLRHDIHWLPGEHTQRATFGSRTSRLSVVSRMSGGRGRGGGRSGGRGRSGGGRGRRGRTLEPAAEDGPLMNENIRAPILRLIGEDAQQIGIVPREDAFRRAEVAELDLVIIAPDADPPVAKLMDYSKYKYEQHKKKRDQQKKAAATRVELKELKMRYNIDTHDYEVRLKQARNFLKDGDKVKVVMPFRGREAQFKDLGVKLLKKFEEDVGECGSLEGKLSDEGRTMHMTFAANKVQPVKGEKRPKSSTAPSESKASDESGSDETDDDEEEDEEDSEDSREEAVKAEPLILQ